MFVYYMSLILTLFTKYMYKPLHWEELAPPPLYPHKLYLEKMKKSSTSTSTTISNTNFISRFHGLVLPWNIAKRKSLQPSQMPDSNQHNFPYSILIFFQSQIVFKILIPFQFPIPIIIISFSECVNSFCSFYSTNYFRILHTTLCTSPFYK